MDLNNLYKEDEQIKEWVDFIVEKVFERLSEDIKKYGSIKKAIKESNND